MLKKNSSKIIIIIAIIVIAVVATIIFCINKDNKYSVKLENIEKSDAVYFLLQQDSKYGVIDKDGNVVVKPEYESVTIPNPTKDVFICSDDNDSSKVLNNKGEQILSNYSNVQAITIPAITSLVPYEKTTLIYEENQLYGIMDFDGNKITVKGPKGTLEKELHPNMKITLENNVITVTRPDDEPQNRSLHGLTRTLINNMINGVVNEYTRELEINGVGYRAAKQGNKLVLTLGYSHPVEMVEPEGIKYEVPTPNQIIVKGMDKELVGEMAAVIRTKRPPEVYRGKGIKYVEEHIRRKVGKTGKK